ncbi:MAG TPA: RNA methyltransferase [Chloroflexota bacterium]|jgi:TrmH family RNA methyltransferase
MARTSFRASESSLVARLRRLRSASGREEAGACYVEGIGPLVQAWRAGAAIELCVVATALLAAPAGRSLVDSLRTAGVPVVELSSSAFARISFRDHSPGLGAVVRPRLVRLERLDPARAPYWLALAGVGNPGNLGAMLRTCDAVGCGGVLLLGSAVDPFHPVAVRASRGTVFALPIARASGPAFAAWTRAHRCTVVGTSPSGEHEYRSVRYAEPLVLLMGGERRGLPDELAAACDLLVRVPMIGRADSLNLAVAASVVLYELFAQLGARPSSAPEAT